MNGWLHSRWQLLAFYELKNESRGKFTKFTRRKGLQHQEDDTRLGVTRP